ncbi:MAG: hypothetical protein AB8F95_22525 [Bacteroidia bacterium]
MNFFFALLFSFLGLTNPPPSASSTLSQDGVSVKKDLKQSMDPKRRHADITGGTSIIVVIDDTEYRPIFD